MPLDVAAIGAGDVLADKFRVIRRLGEGGMGAVFEVEHLLTHHRRALKLLHAHVSRNATVVQRFLREASAGGRIGDPHIAETFDAGQLATGEYYLVMEFLRGHTLGDHLARLGRPAALAEIVELIGQVCGAVAAAHLAGVVHRDLKPDNLFVIEAQGRPFVKVLDFGISKFSHELTAATPLTREGNMLGTPYYMSPEQFRGQADVDGRSDVYSLGVILYELASGQRPYEADSLPELVLAIAQASPVPLGRLRPDLPAAFVAVVERAMSSDRLQRPASASELARELQACLAPSASPGARTFGATLDPLSQAPPWRSPDRAPASGPASARTPAQTPVTGPSTPFEHSADSVQAPGSRSRLAGGALVAVVVAVGLGGLLWRARTGADPGTASSVARSLTAAVSAEASAPSATEPATTLPSVAVASGSTPTAPTAPPSASSSGPTPMPTTTASTTTDATARTATTATAATGTATTTTTATATRSTPGPPPTKTAPATTPPGGIVTKRDFGN